MIYYLADRFHPPLSFKLEIAYFACVGLWDLKPLLKARYVNIGWTVARLKWHSIFNHFEMCKMEKKNQKISVVDPENCNWWDFFSSRFRISHLCLEWKSAGLWPLDLLAPFLNQLLYSLFSWCCNLFQDTKNKCTFHLTWWGGINPVDMSHWQHVCRSVTRGVHEPGGRGSIAERSRGFSAL